MFVNLDVQSRASVPMLTPQPAADEYCQARSVPTSNVDLKSTVALHCAGCIALLAVRDASEVLHCMALRGNRPMQRCYNIAQPHAA